MAKKRRVHSSEFNLEAIRLLETGNLKLSEVARDLDITPGLLRSWRKKFSDQGADAFPGHGRVSDAEAENLRLRKENTRLKQERDFLKKAAVYSMGRCNTQYRTHKLGGGNGSVGKTRFIC